MATAIDCSVGWTKANKIDSESQLKDAMFSNVNFRWSGKICERLGLESVDPPTASFSLIPALFISGTLDTNTPPYQAEKIRWAFPNSDHIIIDALKHCLTTRLDHSYASSTFSSLQIHFLHLSPAVSLLIGFRKARPSDNLKARFVFGNSVH